MRSVHPSGTNRRLRQDYDSFIMNTEILSRLEPQHMRPSTKRILDAAPLFSAYHLFGENAAVMACRGNLLGRVAAVDEDRLASHPPSVRNQQADEGDDVLDVGEAGLGELR